MFYPFDFYSIFFFGRLMFFILHSSSVIHSKHFSYHQSLNQSIRKATIFIKSPKRSPPSSNIKSLNFPSFIKTPISQQINNVASPRLVQRVIGKRAVKFFQRQRFQDLDVVHFCKDVQTRVLEEYVRVILR